MKILEMSKDQLEAYAKESFGVDLDKRQKIDDLRKQVTDLESVRDGNSQGDDIEGQDQVQTQSEQQGSGSEGDDFANSENEQENKPDTQDKLVSGISYLKNPKTGVVFVATKALEKRGDLVPCSAPKK